MRITSCLKLPRCLFVISAGLRNFVTTYLRCVCVFRVFGGPGRYNVAFQYEIIAMFQFELSQMAPWYIS